MKYNFKTPYCQPDLEDLKTDYWYAFSLMPKEQPCDMSGSRPIQEWYNYVNDYLKKYQHFFQVDKMYIEISTENQRWHFHGYILISDAFDFYYKGIAILKAFGTYAIKDGDFSGTKYKTWNDYIIKQQAIMLPKLQNRISADFKYLTTKVTSKQKRKVLTDIGIDMISTPEKMTKARFEFQQDRDATAELSDSHLDMGVHNI